MFPLRIQCVFSIRGNIGIFEPIAICVVPLAGTIGLGVPRFQIVMDSGELGRPENLVRAIRGYRLWRHGSDTAVGVERYRCDIIIRHMDSTVSRCLIAGCVLHRVSELIITCFRNIEVAGDLDISRHVAIVIVNGVYAIHGIERCVVCSGSDGVQPLERRGNGVRSHYFRANPLIREADDACAIDIKHIA